MKLITIAKLYIAGFIFAVCIVTSTAFGLALSSQKKNLSTVYPEVLHQFDTGIYVLKFNQISQTNDKTIFIGGRHEDKGLLLKVRNKKLSAKKLSFIKEIRYLFFLTKDIGWISDWRDLYRTGDGGNSWTRVNNPDILLPRAMCFLDDKSGWIAGKNGRISRIDSADNIQAISEESGWSIKKIQFIDVQNGWFSAYDLYDHSFGFFYSSDGGRNWNEIKVQEESGIADFCFLDSQIGYVITSRNKVFSTSDGGHSWKLVKSRDNFMHNSLMFLDKNNGWVAGDNICATSDAGASWSCYPFRNEFVEQVSFLDKSHGWLITSNKIFFSGNGGRSWKKRVDYKSRLLKLS